MKKTAIILGATGLSGSLLLNKLAQDDNYECIKLFLRKSSGHHSPKVKEFIGDVIQLESFKDDFVADEVFCCVGTTAAKTKDKEEYKAIDMGIPAKAAQLCQENGISVFMVISAIGANATSSVFYNRTKGQMEEAVLSHQISHTNILRPSLIIGHRPENRLGESMAAVMMKLLNPLFIGKLKKYRSIKAETIAKAMYLLANVKMQMPIVIQSDMIQELVDDHEKKML